MRLLSTEKPRLGIARFLAAGSLNRPRSTTQKVEHDGNDGQDEQDVDESSGGVKRQKASQPQHYEHNSNSEKHSVILPDGSFINCDRVPPALSECELRDPALELFSITKKLAESKVQALQATQVQRHR